MEINLKQAITITEASRNLAKVIKNLPEKREFIVVKNYKPVAKISLPDNDLLATEAKKVSAQKPIDLTSFRKKVWGKYTDEIRAAFAKLEQLPEAELPFLLKTKNS